MDNINNKENYLILNKYLNKDEKILLTFPERNFNKNKFKSHEKAAVTDKRFIYLYNIDDYLDSSMKYLPLNEIKGFSQENVRKSYINISLFFIFLGILFLLFLRNGMISLLLFITATLFIIFSKKYVNIIILTGNNITYPYKLKFNNANPDEIGNFIFNASVIIDNLKS